MRGSTTLRTRHGIRRAVRRRAPPPEEVDSGPHPRKEAATPASAPEGVVLVMSSGLALCEVGSHGSRSGGFCRVGPALCEAGWIASRWARITQAGPGSTPAPGSTVLGSVAADAMSDLRSALAPTRAIAAGSSSSRPEPIAEPAPPGEERRRCPTAGAVISGGADAPSSGWYCASGPETSPFFANAQISSRTRRWGRRVRLETSAFAESGVRRRPRADGDDSPGTGRRTRPGPDEHRSPSPGATARKVQDYSGENRLTGLHEKGSPV